jgi:catechol 2,3-dioxygenase-like lactoylglutathione lyase family enzyme
MGLHAHPIGPVCAVADFARARTFYEDQLGLAPDEVMEEYAVRYPCGNGSSLMVYVSEENAGTSTATVAGWAVDDLDREMAELEARGVAFERYDQPGVKTDERGVFRGPGFRAAWFRDPDGNTFALNQED